MWCPRWDTGRRRTELRWRTRWRAKDASVATCHLRNHNGGGGTCFCHPGWKVFARSLSSSSFVRCRSSKLSGAIQTRQLSAFIIFTWTMGQADCLLIIAVVCVSARLSTCSLAWSAVPAVHFLHCVICVFCLLVVLVRLSVPVQVMTGKTRLRNDL